MHIFYTIGTPGFILDMCSPRASLLQWDISDFMDKTCFLDKNQNEIKPMCLPMKEQNNKNLFFKMGNGKGNTPVKLYRYQNIGPKQEKFDICDEQ